MAQLSDAERELAWTGSFRELLCCTSSDSSAESAG